LPSRASSGLSTTPSKAAAGAAASLSVSLPPAGIADAHGSPVNKDRHATEWGPHLLSDFMAQSSLANELRMLYHNIQGKRDRSTILVISAVVFDLVCDLF